MSGKLKGMSIVLAMVGLSTMGCCSKFQQRIDQLVAANSSLSTSSNELRGKLSRALHNENLFRNKFRNAESELVVANAKIGRLESRLSAPAKDETVARKSTASETRLYEVTLGSDVLFASGRATLTVDGKKALNRIAAKLKKSFSRRVVRVYGHTDSDRIRKTRKLWKDNLDLSANRAMAVTRYLVLKGVTASRVETVAMGKTRPVESNRTKAGKKKNRRVEIIVIKK